MAICSIQGEAAVDKHLPSNRASLFDAAAKSIDIKIEDSSDDQDGDKDSDSDNNKAIPKSLNLSRTSTGILSTRTPSSVPSTQLAFEQAKQSIAKRKLYSRFRKGQTYTGGELQKFLQEPKQRVPETQQPKPSKKKRKAEDESGKSKSSKKSSKNKGNAWMDLL